MLSVGFGKLKNWKAGLFSVSLHLYAIFTLWIGLNCLWNPIEIGRDLCVDAREVFLSTSMAKTCDSNLGSSRWYWKQIRFMHLNLNTLSRTCYQVACLYFDMWVVLHCPPGRSLFQLLPHKSWSPPPGHQDKTADIAHQKQWGLQPRNMSFFSISIFTSFDSLVFTKIWWVDDNLLQCGCQ